jgi:hypothetical protein
MLLQQRQSAPGDVFFVMDHAARSFPSEEVRLAFLGRTNKTVGRILNPKGTNGNTTSMSILRTTGE